MKLLRTHDGVIGWKFNTSGKVRWMKTENQAKMFGLASLNIDPTNPLEVKQYYKDFDAAITEMSKHNHTMAQFGIFGGFMWTGMEHEEA